MRRFRVSGLRRAEAATAAQAGVRCQKFKMQGIVRFVLFVRLVELVVIKPNQLNKLNQSNQLNRGSA